MKRILLIGLAFCLMWLSQPQSAIAGWINSEESALTSYLEALHRNQLERLAEIDCWGYRSKKLLGLKSWDVKPGENDGWKVSIVAADDKVGKWKFIVTSAAVYRLSVDWILDKTVNQWAATANRVGKAIGFDLKEPDPLNPEDIGIRSKERFCIFAHFQEG